MLLRVESVYLRVNVYRDVSDINDCILAVLKGDEKLALVH